MAGGKGIRLRKLEINENSRLIPKPMVKVCRIPILEREIDVLKRQGFTDIIITVGYLANEIEEYFGDGNCNSPATGLPFGVHIEYYREVEPLGNAGALLRLKEQLKGDFLLLNGDLAFDIDINRLIDYHFKKDSLATIFTHPNNHPYDSGLILTDCENRVVKWIAKEDIRPIWYKNRVNAGIHVISSAVLEGNTGKNIDLDRDILKPMSGKGKLFAYDSPEYVKDMGTLDRFNEVEADIQSGLPKRKNLSCKQKAIFIDRDGTINKYVGFLTKISDFELIEGVAEAIRKINKAGWLAIVVTNQPVIARGELTMTQLTEIHNKMETLLGNNGAYLDGIYFCPHHPDSGYEGEITNLKIECDCRKPKPGMLLKAARDFNIDLGSSWIVGDGENDILAGINAHCHTCRVNADDSQLYNGSVIADISAKNLMEFIDKLGL